MIFSQKNFPMSGSGDERRTAILFRCCLVSLFISLAGTAIMEAQEVEFAVPDGLMLKKDPFSFRPAGIPMSLHPEFPTFRKQMPMIYSPESETEEERAARINALTMNRVMKSVDMHLNRYRTSRYANLFGGRLSISGLFPNTPFGTDSFGTGKRWMPLMNPSYPFLYIQVPGMSPSINP